MIDIHTHLLYGVDDGCKTLEDSVKMIESAFSYGITDIILTPHYSYLRKYTVDKIELNNRYEILKGVLKDRKINVKLYLGSEIDQDTDLIQFLKDDQCYTLNDTNYVLVDFGMKKCDIDDFCYELIVAGYTPIIAHPERYRYVTDIKEYRKWKKTGALIQLNASSLYHQKNSHTKKMAKLALKANLVDFIASDTHQDPKRFEYLQKAYQQAFKKTNQNDINKIFEFNPNKLIFKSKE